MRAGQLRHQITIQRPVETQDAAGGVVTSWVDVASPRAEVVGLAGREYFAAQGVHSEITTKIRIRYRAGLSATMRALHGATVYEIAAPPLDPTGKRDELHLLCKVVA